MAENITTQTTKQQFVTYLKFFSFKSFIISAIRIHAAFKIECPVPIFPCYQMSKVKIRSFNFLIQAKVFLNYQFSLQGQGIILWFSHSNQNLKWSPVIFIRLWFHGQGHLPSREKLRNMLVKWCHWSEMPLSLYLKNFYILTRVKRYSLQFLSYTYINGISHYLERVVLNENTLRQTGSSSCIS